MAVRLLFLFYKEEFIENQQNKDIYNYLQSYIQSATNLLLIIIIILLIDSKQKKFNYTITRFVIIRLIYISSYI